MFDAQILQTMPDGGVVSVYSPWFPRGGDRAIFTLEIVETNLHGSASLVVQAFHKNSEDVGDGTLISGASISAGGVGVSSQLFGPFEELVRYKFSIAAEEEFELLWAAFRMLSPAWFDAV